MTGHGTRPQGEKCWSLDRYDVKSGLKIFSKMTDHPTCKLALNLDNSRGAYRFNYFCWCKKNDTALIMIMYNGYSHFICTMDIHISWSVEATCRGLQKLDLLLNCPACSCKLCQTMTNQLWKELQAKSSRKQKIVDLINLLDSN